jgi:hypothetical protein
MRYARGLLGGLVLASAIGLVQAQAPGLEILDLAGMIEKGKNAKEVEARVAGLKKRYEELNDLMHVFKPKKRGGIGYGPDPNNGIEAQIQKMDRSREKEVSRVTLQKEKAELIKMAYINLAMARVVRAYAPDRPKGGKTKKDWDDYADAQEKAARDLLKSVKAGDGKTARDAITRLNGACTSCHSDFRDNN